MGLTLGSLERSLGEPVRFIEAADGLDGIKLAWRHRPDFVVVDEITSRAGAFAVTRDLKGAVPPLPAHVIIFLERREDTWLAAWSGADAWFVKPVNPFDVADTVRGLLNSPMEEVG